MFLNKNCFPLLASLLVAMTEIPLPVVAKLPSVNQTNRVKFKQTTTPQNLLQSATQITDPNQMEEWEKISNQAEEFYAKQDYQTAQYWYEILNTKSQGMNYPGGEIIALTGIARSAFAQSNYNLALQSAKKAQNVLTSANLRDFEKVNKLLDLQGQISEAQGNLAQALNYYLPALKWYEKQWQIYQPVDLWRSRWAREATPLYYRLIQLLLKNDPAQAFEIAELDKARGLIYHMTYGPLSPLRHEYATRQTLRQLQAQIDLTEEPSQELINAYDQHRRKFQTTHPDITQRATISPPSVKEVQEFLRQLDPEVTIVSYTITEQMVVAFVISTEEFHAIPLPVTPAELSKRVTQFTLSNKNSGASSIEQLQNHQYLYRYLVAPLLQHLKTKRIGIIPHRYLHQIPFAILQSGTRKYFDQEYEIFYLPNTSFLRLLAQKYPTVQRFRENAVKPKLLIMASPWYQNRPVIDKVITEARTIASLYGASFYFNQDATATRFWRLAPESDVIHIASHAVFNENNPLWSKIILYKDAVSEGRIYLHQLYDRLHLRNTDLVVLSACQTNKSNANSDGDEHVTISRAFLGAGARTVISSFWIANDTPTSQLMTRFYRLYRNQGVSKLTAIREAQREVRKSMNNSNEWSNFSLMGDWR